ncbi:phenazine biosynthesis protein PhzF family [Streptomyces sp. DvalAA-14]|uniref:PhzF family phenazine biosynthesis protein n=1 Tax=unclassified Streptomyces TaxID=2593676 RepID=UPI00081BAA05|nr:MULTISPECIES: PhzF family phenazine biosynthesis protein [unclassified Streptomyces]MYS23248.1 PhzF family phenazine biosynthesis isomerase [Streptomyces sp. SID4948]SCE30119.1 phenazine biosynthesis protein PhzF family [Streptomyces sp. DvalAA-14]
MRIRIVDAFTDRPFAGNPAGVVLLGSDEFPDAGWMQQVAAELNLSETAFAHPMSGDAVADWALRWFTPVTEVGLCGHATLATAHVLRTTGAAQGTVWFRTRAGVLSATAEGDGTITLDFPMAPLTPVAAPAGLAQALGTAPLSVLDTGPDCGDLLVEVADEATVRALAPDLAALGRLSQRGLIATAAAADPGQGYDFVSRGFFPAVGIDEDPVTGSAHTALAPFWSRRLGRDRLTGLQASARTGLIATRLSGDRVLLTGAAVTVVDGELHAVP